MLLFLSLTGIFLSLLLIYFKRRNHPATVFLGLFFLSLSVYAIVFFMFLFSGSQAWVGSYYKFVFIFTPFAYLIGPFFYLYYRSLIQDRVKLFRSDLLHLLPMLLFMTLLLRHFILDATPKDETTRQILQNQIHYSGRLQLFINVPFPVIYLALSRPVLVLFYIFWSGILLIRTFRTPENQWLGGNPLFNKRWLILLWALFFTITSTHSIQLLLAAQSNQFEPMVAINVLQIVTGSSLSLLLASPFFFPGILYGLAKLPDSVPQDSGTKQNSLEPGNMTLNEIQAEIQKPSFPGARNNAFKLESDYLDFIQKETEQCMTDFQPFLQPDFNLTQLSVLVNVPVHHLTYFFREKMKISYTEFRNCYRVKYAKNLLHEGKSSELTLEAIGILSGFSSRNTFLAAFKKSEGISPQAYLNQIKNKDLA